MHRGSPVVVAFAALLLACGAAPDDGSAASIPGDDGTTAPADAGVDPRADARADAGGDSPSDARASGDGVGRDPADGMPSLDAGRPVPPRGADVPWDEYELEDGVTTGTVLGPSRAFGALAAESSGRRAVRLAATGDAVRFTALRAASSIVVRFAIPDAPGGGGLEATLSLYVDGVFRTALHLTSRYAWIYGGEAGSSANDPSLGGAHHFFDEARALVGDIPAGASVELRKGPSDGADWYVLDLVDLEPVPAPLAKPAGALSIVDFGAVADDGLDDGPAIQKAVDAARAAGHEVWLPPGTFESTTAAIDVSAVTISGAGMWRTTVHGLFARFRCTGDGCRFHDFSILGETVARDDASPESGFLGAAGTGSRLENVWVEHTKTGWWVGPGPTDGLVIRGCRFRDLFADGVNLCNGASHSVVEQSHARNTGDDGFASWSPASEGGPNVGNVFRFDSVQLPWRASCFAIYGGGDNRIEDSICSDVVEYPGVLIAQQFHAHPFTGTTSVARTTLARAGGAMWGQQHGALKVHGFDGPVHGVAIADVDVVDPTFSGLHLQGPGALDAVTFSSVRISGAGTAGLRIDADAAGSAAADRVVVTGSAGLSDDAPAFVLTRGAGNVGW